MRYNQSMAQILSEMQAQEGRMKDLSMKVNKVIAKMKKDRQMKGFADKFKRDVMRSMDIEKSLEKVLPDYIAGKEIQKLVKEQEGEQEDPIDQAKKKIDKIKKLAVLKKQMQDIQKSDEDTDLEEKVEYIEYKFRNSKQAVDAVRFVQAMNTGVPRNLDINSDGENRGIIVFDAGKEDFTRVHKMIMKKFRPQILAVEKNDLEEFKKMVVTIKDPLKRRKAMDDIKRFGKKTGFRIDKMRDGKSFKIDGKGADLNKFATDMKNFYGAEIKAESIEEARWQIEGQVSYKGIRGYDGFEMVIDAPNEKSAEQKAEKELEKARDKRKIGPGGGGNLDDIEIEFIQRTSDRVQAPSTFRVSEFDPSKDVNEATVTIKSYDTKTGLDRQSEKQMNAVAQRAGAKVKKAGNNVYKVTGNGKQLSKFMANIDQIDGSFMTEENEFIIEFTDKQIARLKKEYESLRGKTRNINPERFKQLRGMMKRFPKANLLKLAKEDIPLLSSGAKAALIMYHGMKWEQLPEEFVPYLELFAEEVDEQKGKFKEVDPKVYARIAKMMRGRKDEKQSLANMLNYFMPPEVVDMVRDKFGIKMPRGKIKFTDL